jgi:uncharacterized membrane protein
MSIRDAFNDFQCNVDEIRRTISASIVRQPATDILETFLASLISIFLGVIAAGIVIPFVLIVKLALWIAGKIRGNESYTKEDSP